MPGSQVAVGIWSCCLRVEEARNEASQHVDRVARRVDSRDLWCKTDPDLAQIQSEI